MTRSLTDGGKRMNGVWRRRSPFEKFFSSAIELRATAQNSESLKLSMAIIYESAWWVIPNGARSETVMLYIFLALNLTLPPAKMSKVHKWKVRTVSELFAYLSIPSKPLLQDASVYFINMLNACGIQMWQIFSGVMVDRYWNLMDFSCLEKSAWRKIYIASFFVAPRFDLPRSLCELIAAVIATKNKSVESIFSLPSTVLLSASFNNQVLG